MNQYRALIPSSSSEPSDSASDFLVNGSIRAKSETTFTSGSRTVKKDLSYGFRSEGNLPTAVAECFRNPSVFGDVETCLLKLIGRGSRYHVQTPLTTDTSVKFFKSKLKRVCHNLQSKLPSYPNQHNKPLPLDEDQDRMLTKGGRENNNPRPPQQYYWGGGSREHSVTEEDAALLQQYLSLRQWAVSRRHCKQLRNIRDSLAAARYRSHRLSQLSSTGERETLRNFLLDVGFLQYYVNFNRHGYDFQTATHMNVLDLAAIGVTEPLHRMALKYELEQVRRPIPIPECLPPTTQEWLDALGLPDYIENFQRNNIHTPLEALGLSKYDLQFMGVYMLGHRKKIILSLTALKKSIL